MIPNFKTYIKESVWGDLHSRGIGELEREEDKGRINLLDKDEFFKYIKSNYEVFGTNSIIEYIDKRFIVIPILKELHNGIIKKIYIDLSFGIIDIYFWVSKPLEKLLKSKYKISKLTGPHWMIEQEERDWNRLNEFYIDVIDTLITFDPSVLRKKGINESVWGDLHSRGIGETEREEDRIRTKEELIKRMQGEYEKQNSAETHILDLTMLDVSLVEDMSDLFDGDLTTITTLDVSNWNVSNVEDMGGMFWYCKNLQTLDVSKWDVSNVRTMQFMFFNCKNLQVLDVSNWDVSNVVNMSHMFDSCKNLQTLDVSKWDVSNVRTMPFMFFNCKNLQTLDVSGWNKEQQEQIPPRLRKVTESVWADLHSRGIGETDREEEIMCPADKYELIECIKQQYEKQGKGENLDLTMIDVSDVEDMRSLFECLFGSLNSWDNSQTIKYIDMSNWDVSHVKYMDRMFYGCGSIESLEVSDWDVSSVFHMSSMFQNCGNLESIDVSKWKMYSATNLYAMFFRCKKLKTLDVANWDVSHVEVMSEMFSGCKELESLDISNWKPKKLLSAAWMFNGCDKLQPVDVSKWDKSKQNKIPARYIKITESVWGDLHSRGIGETEREEDDVNLLDREGLLDYLKSHYSIDGDSINPTLHSIEVPVLKPAFLDKNGWATYVSLDYTPDGKKEVTILDDFPEYFEYVFKRLKKEYPIYHNSGVSFVIQPKSAKEECTNKFFIEVIDFIINTAKRELVIKKI